MAHFAKFILLIVSIWSPFFCFAQDGLILYTKTGCSNCAYAKTALQNNNIKFREYNVDVASNAQKMLKLLKEKKYQGVVFMPVMVLNNSLLFPSAEQKDTLIPVSLFDAVNKLVGMKKPQAHLSESGNETSNCQFTESKDLIYVLVCGNFKDVSEANHFAEVLKNEGYLKAYVKNWQNLFRVIIADSSNKEDLEILLKNVSLRYRGSYILSVKE